MGLFAIHGDENDIRALARRVSSGTYVSEAAIWLNWKHCGTLIAKDHCELVAVIFQEFQKVVNSSDGATARNAIRKYAHSFVELCRNMDFPSDLISPPPEVAETAFALAIPTHSTFEYWARLAQSRVSR